MWEAYCADCTTKGDKMAEKSNKAKKTEIKNDDIEKKVKDESVVDSQRPEVVKETAPAKAGKRSAKALKLEAEEQAKAERKNNDDDGANEEKPKKVVKPPRSRLERRGKKYKEVAKLVDKEKVYTLSEALEIATKTSPVKFDASVELHINLNVDPKQSDQNVRDTIVLPQGTGKSVRIAVFGDSDTVAAAKKAGADVYGSDEFLQQLDKENINFDVLIATPAFMPKLGKYARMLGPKGLMPNPKSGTVTNDVTKAIEQSKAGQVEYRVDSTGIVHLSIGKVSFGGKRLTENALAVITNLRTNKPASVKGNLIETIHVTTSMGPSLKVDSSQSSM